MIFLDTGGMASGAARKIRNPDQFNDAAIALPPLEWLLELSIRVRPVEGRGWARGAVPSRRCLAFVRPWGNCKSHIPIGGGGGFLGTVIVTSSAIVASDRN